jgi:multisubunit Na+/H+ antiporter MnhG subunit
LEQEAEILSGSVIGFLLLATAACLNVWAYPGWARTLIICAAASFVTAVGAWRISRVKHQAAAMLARRTGSQARREVDRDAV